MRTDREVHGNAAELATVRVSGRVAPARLNQVVAADGRLVGLPGQGGAVVGVGLGDPAGGWLSDHLEPGVTVSHPDPAADRALQVLACVGNRATVRTGAAAGLDGFVYGKHGGVLVIFPADRTHLVVPGDVVSVDAVGVGLRVEGEPDVHLHSCSPEVLALLAPGRSADGRLRVVVRAELPAEAAGAGIGMPAHSLNLDVEVDRVGGPPLRFGDLVALRDADHQYGRQHRPGWTAAGVVAHGRSAGGGHGLGLVTLLTAPSCRLAVEARPAATVAAPAGSAG